MTRQSTIEIENIISTLQKNVEQAINYTKNCRTLANQVDELMKDVVISYSEIVGFMSNVSDLGLQLALSKHNVKDTAELAFSLLQQIKESSNHTTSDIDDLQTSNMALSKRAAQLGVDTSSAGRDYKSEVNLFN